MYIMHFAKHCNVTLPQESADANLQRNLFYSIIATPYVTLQLYIYDARFSLPTLLYPPDIQRPFQPLPFSSPFNSFFSSLLSTLLFPRDGEKSTELLIGSVNLDEKRKRDIQVGIEFCRKCQSTVHVHRKDSLRDDSCSAISKQH